MNELEHLEASRIEQWAKAKGHYQAVEAIARYKAYLASRKEHETEALRERTKDD